MEKFYTYCWWFRNPHGLNIVLFHIIVIIANWRIPFEMINIPLFTTGFKNIPGGFLAGFLNHQEYVYLYISWWFKIGFTDFWCLGIEYRRSSKFWSGGVVEKTLTQRFPRCFQIWALLKCLTGREKNNLTTIFQMGRSLDLEVAKKTLGNWVWVGKQSIPGDSKPVPFLIPLFGGHQQTLKGSLNHPKMGTKNCQV